MKDRYYFKKSTLLIFLLFLLGLLPLYSQEPNTNQGKWSMGAWGGVLNYPVSPSTASMGGASFGINAFYQTSNKLKVGVDMGNLPFSITTAGLFSSTTTTFSFVPIQVQAKYSVAEKFYLGGGGGLALGMGAISGYGFAASALGGYLYSLNERLSLDLGLRSYIIKDSQSDPYINLIPTIGMSYNF